MKLGYAQLQQKNKSKQKKKATKKRKSAEAAAEKVAEADGAGSMDVEEEEAAMAVVDVSGGDGEQPDDIDYSRGTMEAELVPVTAKARQQNRMALKHSLKVRVKGLKSVRTKLTKLPGNRDSRRQLSSQLKGLIKEQQGL